MSSSPTAGASPSLGSILAQPPLAPEVSRGSVVTNAPRPWWRRPSPWWLMGLYALTSGAEIAVLPTRVHILTGLVCDAIKPDYSTFHDLLLASDRCTTDPAVQAGVARLEGVLLAITGLLSVLTLAWWGSMSDRYGRTRIICTSVLGILFDDLAFLAVSRYASILPGGYWFLAVGSFLSGISGGVIAASVAMTAYVSDCSAPDQRSRNFTLLTAAMFLGASMGPTAGALITKWTQIPLITYYVLLAAHLFTLIFIWTIVPESLAVTLMAAARRSRAEQQDITPRAGLRGSMERFMSQATAFIRPLSLFLPVRIRPAAGKSVHWDWSITLVAAASASIGLMQGGTMFKLQYMLLRFSWSSEQLSYYLTTLSVSRVIFMALILPLIIHIFKPKESVIELPVDSGETSAEPFGHAQASHQLAVLRFDYWLAFASMLCFLVAYVGLCLAPTGTLFTIASAAVATGGGLGPAAQSILLGLYSARVGAAEESAHAGALLGALGVLVALVSQVLSPALLGIIYVKTVARLPQAIFIVSAALIALSVVFISLIRLPNGHFDADCAQDGVADGFHAQEPTLVQESATGRDGRKAPTEETPLLS